MARALRIDVPNGLCHVTSRGLERRTIVFQGRFKGVLVEEGHHYWELTRYTHLNPVRARLVDDPEGYQWGSCRCYFQTRLAPEWLAWEETLSEHGGTVRRRFAPVDDGVTMRERWPSICASG